MSKKYKSSFTPDGEDEIINKRCLGCGDILPIKSFKPSRKQKRIVDGIEKIGTVRNAKCLICESTKLTEERTLKLSEIEEIVFKNDSKFERALKALYNHFNDEMDTLIKKVNTLERILIDKKDSGEKITDLPSWLSR